MWTQWKSNRIVQGLKTYKEICKDSGEEEEGNKGHSQASTFQTDKESGSSTENLIHTPKRQKNNQALSALKK